MEKIIVDLNKLRDLEYKKFIEKLIVVPINSKILGVRMGDLRNYGRILLKNKELSKNFIKDLPHEYLEEYHLHGMVISNIKDYDLLIEEINTFLPHIDNWQVLDSFNPKLLGKYKDKTLDNVRVWINSSHPYTIRFAILTLMRYFLGNGYFNGNILEMVKDIKSEEYYVNMARAWFFCEALIKEYDSSIEDLEDNLLDDFTHRMTINKARDSFRISDEKKEYIKGLRR